MKNFNLNFLINYLIKKYFIPNLIIHFISILLELDFNFLLHFLPIILNFSRLQTTKLIIAIKFILNFIFLLEIKFPIISIYQRQNYYFYMKHFIQNFNYY